MKNVIVTGGNGGIGSVVAKGFLSEGARVLLLDRRKMWHAETIKVDVSDRKQLKDVGDFIESEFDGRVDVLVNAAGIYGPIGKLEELDLAYWEETIATNLFGTVNMCALVIPFMKKEKHGSIINFSGGGDGPLPRFTAYSSSKVAVTRFTESLAEELVEYNIFVNAVAPGPVNTALLEEVLEAGVERVGEDFYSASKRQEREGGVSPEHVRDLILFLASGKAQNLTGKLISAIHDNWKNIPEHLDSLNKTETWNIRRVKFL